MTVASNRGDAVARRARVAEFDRFGGPEELRVVEREIPPPGPGEVRVAACAAGLNRAELLFVAGRYLVQPRSLPSRVGIEAAGTVEALGAGVADLEPGQAVSILPSLDPARHGVIDELTVVPVSAVRPAPAGVDRSERVGPRGLTHNQQPPRFPGRFTVGRPARVSAESGERAAMGLQHHRSHHR